MANQNKFYNTVENKNGSTVGGSTVIIRWKTNLKSEDFRLYNETTHEVVKDDSTVARKRYKRTIDDDYGFTVKTNDGYAFPVNEEKAGTYKYSVIVYNQDNGYSIKRIGYNTTTTITFEDYKTAENQALNALISRSGAASKKTVKDKLDTLAYYMAAKGWDNGSFIHPGDAKEGEYADTHGDYGVWFQSRVITCVDATAIIEKCALIFGVPKDKIKVENPANNLSHQYVVITYGGETFPVDGSPWTDIK